MKCLMNSAPAIVIHGGAWAIPEELAPASRDGVVAAAIKGYRLLQTGGTAVDAVQAAVVSLEDDPAFDAGTGSVLTAEGDIEMDAMIMDGETLKAGSVACVQNIKNPVELARLVMDETEHTMLVGKGANQFASGSGIKVVSTESLLTETAKEELERLKKYKTVVSVDFKARTASHDTVGAVAVDTRGNVACATSTGGITAKLPGRVGDSPLIGSGGYADNLTGAVSTTGHGESITKVCLARLITFYINQGLSALEAAEVALSDMLKRVKGSGGAVVVTPSGDIGYSFTTERMAWAYLKDGMLHYGLDPGEDNISVIEYENGMGNNC